MNRYIITLILYRLIYFSTKNVAMESAQKIRILLPLPKGLLKDSPFFRGRTRLAALPFPGLLRDGPPKARLRSGSGGFLCHRQRRPSRLPLPLKSLKSNGFEAFLFISRTFLRQNGPNRIFRRRLLSLLSHLFCKLHAGYCRFSVLFAYELSKNIPKSALKKAPIFASAKLFCVRNPSSKYIRMRLLTWER